MPIFEWQEEIWASLQARRARLPHALLFAGPRGVGKLQFAESLARSLLCESAETSGDGCGACAGCLWFDRGNHPDFRRLTPDTDPSAADAPRRSAATPPTRQIAIDQVRELRAWLEVPGHRGRWRVVIVHPAESMSAGTANALLKTLEEPPSSVVFLLVSHQPDRLPATIVSRCQREQFRLPHPKLAEAWLGRLHGKQSRDLLGLAGGRPLLAAETEGLLLMAQDVADAISQDVIDPLELAERYAAKPLDQTIDLVHKLVFDALCVSVGGTTRYFQLADRQVKRIVARFETERLIRICRDLGDARALAAHPLNPRLVLESLFLRMVETT